MNHGIVAVVYANGVICRFDVDIINMIIRLIRSNEFTVNSDCPLVEISHSPLTVKILVVLLLDIGGKHH